jgi:hypothetical protein
VAARRLLSVAALVVALTLAGGGCGGSTAAARTPKVRPHTDAKPIILSHSHVSLDGKLVQMAHAAQAQLNNLSPGQHALSAEWGASDYLPFANRVVD